MIIGPPDVSPPSRVAVTCGWPLTDCHSPTGVESSGLSDQGASPDLPATGGPGKEVVPSRPRSLILDRPSPPPGDGQGSRLSLS